MADKLMGAVGIFDSGLGGLTAMMALEEICPEADIIYFGDTARVPYGSRPNWELREFAPDDTNSLTGWNLFFSASASGCSRKIQF